MAAPTLVNLQPVSARLLAYQADPFDFHLRLTIDGAPVDVSGWEWRATIEAGRVRIDFEWRTEDDGTGVRLWLRGEDTARLPLGREWPFDVTTRQLEAGEGVTVLRGTIKVAPRFTDPLRSDPDLVATPG